ncbi:MAG: hypothetical protein ACFFCZ_07425 [Promethearchaeota archaeon]
MVSLEERIYQFLKFNKKSKIHVSEINKQIGVSEKEIKDTLLKITAEDPSKGHFEYSTGWLNRKTRMESTNDIKKLLAVFTFVIGLWLLLFVPLYGYFTGFGLMGLGAFYFAKFYQYEELQHRRKADQIERLGAALTTGRLDHNTF